MRAMRIPISKAKGRLGELVRQARMGDEVVLTKHGRAAARIVAVRRVPKNPAEHPAVTDAVRQRGSRATPGPDAARSQDSLNEEETGLPK
jgi:prevent-host-death family protein